MPTAAPVPTPAASSRGAQPRCSAAMKSLQCSARPAASVPDPRQVGRGGMIHWRAAGERLPPEDTMSDDDPAALPVNGSDLTLAPDETVQVGILTEGKSTL